MFHMLEVWYDTDQKLFTVREAGKKDRYADRLTFYNVTRIEFINGKPAKAVLSGQLDK